MRKYCVGVNGETHKRQDLFSSSDCIFAYLIYLGGFPNDVQGTLGATTPSDTWPIGLVIQFKGPRMCYCLILCAKYQPGHPSDSLGPQSLHLVVLGVWEDWAYTLYYLSSPK